MLTNAGTVTMTGSGQLTMYNNNSTYNGGVYNLAGALWDIQTNANIYCHCLGDEFFNNAGTFRKSGGSGTATISVDFINTGTVTNLIGILSFNSGGTLTGTYGTAAGATTDFAGGSFTMGVPPVISGSGLCEFTGTTLTLTQNMPTNLVLAGGSLILGPAFQNSGGITNLTLSGVTLISTNTVTGTLNWASGTVSGPLTIASGGVMNITGSVTLYNVLTNAGTVTMTGAGNVTVYNNNSTYKEGFTIWRARSGTFRPTRTFTAASASAMSFSTMPGPSASPGVRAQAPLGWLHNTGTVTNLIGILSFSGGGTLAGTYGTAAGATTDFAGGSFTMGVPPVISGSVFVNSPGPR